MFKAQSSFLENDIRFRKVPLVDGSFRKIETKALAGYCHCDLHKGYLDVKLLNCHDCIKKECIYPEKFEEYPFWVSYRRQQEEKLHRKRTQKHRLIRRAASQKKLDAEMNRLIEASQSIADKLGYPIIVTRIVPRSKEPTNYEYIINYVSDNCYDDWHHYFDMALMLGKCYGGKYILKHMKAPDGSYISIDYWKSISAKKQV